MDALELSAPTQFGLTATPNHQIWVESKTLKCALFGQIRCFPLGQAVLPERHIEVKRFKTEDGREGSYASLGNGLAKLLFDDGNMAIIREMGEDRSSDPAEDIPF